MIAPNASIAELANETDLHRVHIITWRDLDHPDAGGSELHIAAVARHWALAGIDVTLHTSAVPGLPASTTRDGYRVERRGGRNTVLALTPLRELLGTRERDGLVEVWHGINFFAPLWARGPRIGIAHHVHGEQFHHVLPSPAARLARTLERDVYPRVYRKTPLVTLSESTREELLAIGHRAENVVVVSPGVDERFSPGAQRSPTPLVLSVGRLMPQKRQSTLIDIVANIRDQHPKLELLIVGDGPARSALEAQARSHGDWIRFAGRVDDTTLVDLYRSAWVVASASIAEGWNMTLTEAGACATPAVASRIAGHVDAVIDGHTGLLADDPSGLARALDRILGDEALRSKLGAAALGHAARFTWEAASRDIFAVLASDARRRAGSS